eukprot:CCRYP_016202-RA/>CCRYP_016202-RA protein AED:0.31 eAED:0.33 QI:0/-1/0/1/-1/1/1/0/73
MQLIGEEAKVAIQNIIQNIRQDGFDSIKKMEKAGDLRKDEALYGIDPIQKSTDKDDKMINETVSRKEKKVSTL